MPESANNKGGMHLFQEHNENFVNVRLRKKVTDDLKYDWASPKFRPDYTPAAKAAGV
jgi:hypothetical protein